MLLKNASAFLIDKELDISLVEGCIEIALGEISPMGDARGSETYKSLLLSQLIKAHFITLFPEMNFSEMIKTTV